MLLLCIVENPVYGIDLNVSAWCGWILADIALLDILVTGWRRRTDSLDLFDRKADSHM